MDTETSPGVNRKNKRLVPIKSDKRPSLNEKVVFWTILLTLLLCHAVLIMNQRLFPFVDLPYHLSAATIIKYYDQVPAFQHYFQNELSLKANSFHLFFCISPLWDDIETANRIFYLIYIILFPLSILAMIRVAGGQYWFSLLGFVLLYNYNVIWGFTGFTMALPLFFLLFSLIILAMKKQTVLLELWIACLLCALFFMHTIVTVLALGFSLLAQLAGPSVRSAKNWLARLAALSPATALLGYWWSNHSPPSFNAWEQITAYYQNDFVTNWPERILLLYADNYSLFKGWPGQIIGFVGVLVILTPLIHSLISRKRMRPTQCSKPIRRFVILSTIVLLLLCLFAPHGIEPICWYLYPRFSVLCLIITLVLGSLFHQTRLKPVSVILICLIALCFLMLWADFLQDFDRENLSFQSTFLTADPSKRMAGLMYDFLYRASSAYIHFPNYQIVWNRGIATTRLVEYPFMAVSRKTDFQELPMYHEWITRDNPYDGRYRHLEYILIRGTVPEDDLDEFQDFVVIKQSGQWSLYQASQ
ncbi:hypothetical protein JXQ70_17635 [bacterium]|nr:hypothetical protein [bacterium]